jgi:hypothetical protein
MLKRLLASRRLAVGLVALAVLLASPSLASGFQTEDYMLRASSRAASSLFTNLFGKPSPPTWENYRSKDFGMLPWLAAPDWRVAFWRPWSSFLHNVEYRFLPERALVMHAHSLLWLAALIAAVTALYRRLLGAWPAWVAGLAALLYAIDDGHGPAVGWLANRSALVAAAFGAGALLAHDRWRRDGRLAAGLLAPALFGLALLSAESALGVVGFLVAHAWFVDAAPARRRVLAALPWAAVVVAWSAAYRLQGYGAQGSGAYVDPFTQPLVFARDALVRLPVLLFGAFGTAPIDIYALLDASWLPRLTALACAFLLFVAWLLAPIVRAHESARFWASGTLLSLIPACSALPAERMLFIPGIGASALIALFVAEAFSGGERWRGVARRASYALAVLWLFVHGVASAALLPLRSLGLAQYSAWVDANGEQAFRGVGADQQLVIINTFDHYTGVMMLAMRAAREQPVPAHTRIVYGGQRAILLRRIDPFTLVVWPDRGFMATPSNAVYRSPNRRMRVGEGIQLTGVQIVVSAVDAAGMPREAAFRFAEPLESSRLRFVAWDGRRYAPLSLPPVGGEKVLRPEPIDPLAILALRFPR